MQNFKKVRRTFSTSFKREKVSLIEQGKLKISDVTSVYKVSGTSVRNWLSLYGTSYEKSERVVVEKISEESKNRELMLRISELERIIGKQHLQMIYKDSVIACASEHYGEDIEKKYNSQQ